MKKLFAMILMLALALSAFAVAEEAISYADYMAAEIDDEVTIDCFVQDHQSWWDGKITVYAADADGAYFIYNMACTEEDAAKLEPGTAIRVTGYKAEWSGEIELAEGATFEFIEADPYIAEPLDVTELLGTDVYEAVKALNVGDVIDMEGFLYWYEGVNPHITSVSAAA